MTESCVRTPGAPGRPSVRHEKFLDSISTYPQTGVSRPIIRVLRAASADYAQLWGATRAAVLAECGLRSRFVDSATGWRVVVDGTDDENRIDEQDGPVADAVRRVGQTDFAPGLRQFRLVGIPDESSVVLAVNHLVFDGFSLLLLTQRIADVVEGKVSERVCPHALADAWWAEDRAGGHDGARQHWTQHVERHGIWTSLRLPTLVESPGLDPRPAFAAERLLSPAELPDPRRTSGLGGYGAVPALVESVRAMSAQDDRFGVELISSGRYDRQRAKCVDFLGDYLSVGLSDESLTDREVIARCLDVHRYATYPRHLLRPGDPQTLVPHTANLLYRADDESGTETTKYLRGVAVDVTEAVGSAAGAPTTAPQRVLPGVMASLLRLADGMVRLRLDAASADLRPDVAEDLVDTWAAALRRP